MMRDLKSIEVVQIIKIAEGHVRVRPTSGAPTENSGMLINYKITFDHQAIVLPDGRTHYVLGHSGDVYHLDLESDYPEFTPEISKMIANLI
jgi:hypothetical protein